MDDCDGDLFLPSEAAKLGALTTPTNIPTPPTRPPEDECCHRGCEPCIFDYYERAVDRWSERVRKLGADPDEILRRMSQP